MQQFDFSQEGLRKRLRFIWMVVLVGEPCIFLLILLTTKIETHIFITACAVATISTVALVVVQTRMVKKSLGAMKVLVDNSGIVKHYAGGEQSLAWSDVSGVDVRENPRGDCVYIKLRSRDKKSIHLAGFERMHELVEVIRQNAPDYVAAETKRSKTDPESPVWAVMGGATALAAIAFGRVRGAHFDDIFEFAITGGIGFYLLVYRPMTKQNPGWKRFEILCGVCMILIAVTKVIKIFSA